MSDYNGVDRLEAVTTAFERLSAKSPGLTVSRVGDGARSKDQTTCVVQLSHDGGPVVVLTVGTTKADLTAHSGTATSHAGTAVINDRLEVNLLKNYGWDDAECADANELAYILYKHMLRRHKAA